MQRDATSWTLKTLHDYRKDGTIDEKVPFQRRLVWNTKTKRLLIDSIIKGVGIPELTFWKEITADDEIHHTIDGKQRSNTISEYMDGKFTVRVGTRYLTFAELDGPTRRRIQNYKLNITIYSDCSLDDATNFFQRTNSGVPLNATEKRHGMFGPVRDVCYELSLSDGVDEIGRNTVFDFVSFGGIRGEHERLVAGCFLMEREIENIRNDGRYPDYTTGELNRMYKKQQAQDPTGEVANRIRHNFAALAEIFTGRSATKLMTRAMFLDAYIFISLRLKGTETMNDTDEERMRQYIAWLDANKGLLTVPGGTRPYSLLMRTEGDRAASIRDRQIIFRENFETFEPLEEVAPAMA